jgi:hypothetical protein
VTSSGFPASKATAARTSMGSSSFRAFQQRALGRDCDKQKSKSAVMK